MKQPEIELSSFVFRSILKGLWWSATGILIAICIIITLALLLGSREFGSYDYSNPGSVNFFQSTGNLLSDIASAITGTVALTILGFMTFGMPITLFPSMIGSTLLGIWLYCDGKRDKLSVKKSEYKGMGMGFLGGLARYLFPIRISVGQAFGFGLLLKINTQYCFGLFSLLSLFLPHLLVDSLLKVWKKTWNQQATIFPLIGKL